MEKQLIITAVCGWALPPIWFRDKILEAFPGSTVKVIYPSFPNDSQEAKSFLEASPAELYIGYSLGSLWLLKHQEYLPTGVHKVLLAPILAFLSENNLGGKTTRTQLKYLVRILKRNPEDNSALKTFYTGCEIPFPESLLPGVPKPEILIRGLKFLEKVTVQAHSAIGFRAILGEKDIFVDGSKLKQHLPHLDLVEGAGHAPEKLLQHLVQQIYSVHSENRKKNDFQDPTTSKTFD